MKNRWLNAMLAGGLALSAAAGPPASQPANSALLHISDTHIDPHLTRTPPPDTVRGEETIRWICEQASRPQELSPYDLTTPVPAAVLVTGDLTEYGVIDDTWRSFEDAFKSLPCPLYVTPGNHDNTWTAMYDVMRRRHGGETYSFDLGGCHFICLSSASPQEPVPCIDAKTRAWVKADLDRLPGNTPVFVAMHHALYIDEYANPVERETFIDLLRDFNVVLLLYGHGHSVDFRDNGGVFGVMGGSTFGRNSGYGVLSIQDGRVRYAYRFLHDPQAGQPDAPPAWRKLVDLPLPASAQPRLFEIAAPRPDEVADAAELTVRLAAPQSPALQGVSAKLRIDGKDAGEVPLGAGRAIALEGLAPGAHCLAATVQLPDGRSDTRTRTFQVERKGVKVVWRLQWPTAIKAAPAVCGDLLVVAGTDGIVRGLDKHSGKVEWTFATGGEILATPGVADDTIIVASGDGNTYALDETGRERWRHAGGAPAYGPPLIQDAVAYLGNNQGRVLALRLSDGREVWRFERADFSIESRPVGWNDLVIVGAWDGHLYALDRASGALRWKVPGPKSGEGGAARYYSPADCSPIVAAGQLFVCDRGYMLGSYAADGALLQKWNLKIAAIGATPDGRALLARSIEDRVVRLEPRSDADARPEPHTDARPAPHTGADGHPEPRSDARAQAEPQATWVAEVPAGRFPVPPIEAAGRVYVCGNRGQLSVLDARDGQVVWKYQVTPGFYVMAPLCVDIEGGAATCYAAGMDGTLVALRAE